MLESKKKLLASAVLCAVASVGFVISASAAETNAKETMSHNLDEVVVEGDKDVLPGGFMAAHDRVGILGDIAAIDVPFTQKQYTEKTIETFYDPNQPLNGVLANNPSIRIGSPSPMYTDFSMRGVNMNGSHYYINGIPNMFNQTRSVPAYALESVDIVSGPNTVLNGATFSNNGTNGTDAPAGLLNATTKRATSEPITRYTQRFSGRSTWTEDIDVGRRFGNDGEWGVRVNAHHEDGGLSIEGANVKDKSIYINLDHKDAKSETNLFGGYYDWQVDGGQRWMQAKDVTRGHLPDAPNGKNNLSFAEQTKQNNGYLFTLNHKQKFNDSWSGFVNAGYGVHKEHKWDPNSGSLTLKDDGELSGIFRDYNSESKNLYWQMGVSNETQIGAVKNNMTFAVDYFNYKSRNVNKNSVKIDTDGDKKGDKETQATLGGNIWNGVSMSGTPILGSSLSDAPWSKETAYAFTWADRAEFGKASAYIALQYKDTETTSTKNQKVSKDSLNPTFALAYKPIDNLSVYASHSQSYTKPVIVSGGYVNDNEIFEPIKNKQTELGVKYENAGVLHSLAVFQLDQASYMDEGDLSNPTVRYYTQNGKTEFKGVEYSITGKVAPKWNLMGGLMYLHGERTDTPNVKWNSSNKVLEATQSKDGWYATGTPKWSGVLAAEYEADQNTSLIGRMNYVGESHVNDNGVTAPDYMTFDLGVRHKTEINSTPVTLSAMCYNAFGKDYWISRGTSVALGAPRTFMLSATFDI